MSELVSGRERIASFISDFDDLKKTMLKASFEALLDIPASKQKQILPELHPYIGKRAPRDPALAERLGISIRDLSQFVAVASMLSSFIRTDESDDDIVAGIRTALEIDEPTILATQALLSFLRPDRHVLETLRDKRRLESQTLPSFEGLDTSLDVRLKISSGKVDISVPVIVATLFTDIEEKFLTFQFSKGGLEDLKVAIDKALEELKIAEQWSSSFES